MDNVTHSVLKVDDPKTKDVVDALLVMVLTPHILKYLKQTDPMALKQAKQALLAVGANPEPEIFGNEL